MSRRTGDARSGWLRGFLPTLVLLTFGVMSVGRVDAAEEGSASPALKAQVQAQIDAGEFGPAFETAKKAATPAEQRELMQLILEAQVKAADFTSARRTARRLPAEGRGAATPAPASAPGGSGADFQPLIDLILNQTGGPPDGPWLEIDGEGGTIGSFETGVRVDPNGLLHRLTKQEQNGRLEALGIKARVADLNEDMARASGLRMVSLTRLEKAVAARLDAGQPVLETMRHLAGLSKIQYIFVYPEEGEIVVAGPAEGWRYNANGLAVGVSSGRPTLQLDDLVVVLRTFSTSGQGIFGCSINPRREGLKAVKEYVEASQSRGPLPPGGLTRFLKEIQQRMGLQDVEIYGIPADTRVGRVLVEADYKMKLIGIGKMDGGKGIPDVFRLMTAQEQKNPPPLDALRWWLTMKYDAILHSPNRDVFEIAGSSVLVQSEDQIVTDGGDRIQTGKATGANQLFAKNFTNSYAELASRELVFADLQNIFDLGMVAALCQREGLAEQAGWDMGVFAPQGDYQVAVMEAPKVVESVINHRVYGGRDIVVQVAGGVRGDILSVVRNEAVTREAANLRKMGDRAKVSQLPEGRWWWDAAE